MEIINKFNVFSNSIFDTCTLNYRLVVIIAVGIARISNRFILKLELLVGAKFNNRYYNYYTISILCM